MPETVESGSQKFGEYQAGKYFSAKLYLNRRQISRVLADDDQALKAMQGIARLAGDHARVLAPVKTGALRDSIYEGVWRAVDGNPVAVVGADVPYALYQELGTRLIPASPYLRPALYLALGQVGLELRGSYSGRRGFHGGVTTYYKGRAIWGGGKFYGGRLPT